MSYDDVEDYADTPLGEILGLEKEHDTVMVNGEAKPVPECVIVCEGCLEHLEATEEIVDEPSEVFSE